MTRKKSLLRPSLIAGSLIILVFVVAAVGAPLIAPPVEQNIDSPELIPSYGMGASPTPPSAEHRLGLLSGEYDIFYGLIWGARAALQAGVIVVAGRLAIGMILGLISGYYGKVVDAVLMRLTDAFLAFPIMAAAMVAVVLFGRETQYVVRGFHYLMPSHEEQVLMVTLVAFGWMPYARLIRGNLLAEREKEYVQAAHAAGVRSWRIILRHLLPNSVQGLFVTAASDVGAVVVLLATFTFVGLIHPSFEGMKAEWGHMLTNARNWIIGSPANAFEYWYTYIPVSAAIILFAVGWNLIGDGLRDALDPRQE